MGLFSNIGNWFQKAGNSIYKAVIQPVGNGIVKASTTVYNSVLKPVYNKVVSPVIDTGVKFVQKAEQDGEKLMDAGVDTTIALQKASGQAASGLGGFLSNPTSYLLIGAGALIILPRILK